MQGTTIKSNLRKAQTGVCRFKILSVLVFMVSGIGVAEANQSQWSAMFQTYMDDGATSCSSCHGVTLDMSLEMEVPDTVPFDANDVELTLDGISSSANFKRWRYQSTGAAGDAELVVGDITNSTKRTIGFDTADSEITVRSCLLNANQNGVSGSGLYPSNVVWHCQSKTVTREAAPPNQPPTITSSLPSDKDVESDSTPFVFTVTATDDAPGVTLSV
ncbi:MAG: hypothetical protein ACI9UN_004488, partial [Granulosicoccus sp.]